MQLLINLSIVQSEVNADHLIKRIDKKMCKWNIVP